MAKAFTLKDDCTTTWKITQDFSDKAKKGQEIQSTRDMAPAK